MQFLDFEDSSLDALGIPDGSDRVGRYRLDCAAKAQKHKDDVLSLVKKLSVDPEEYVIGYNYTEERLDYAKALRFCAFEERPIYEHRMRQLFWRCARSLKNNDEKSGGHNYGLYCPARFPKDLKDLPNLPAIYFCCEEGTLLEPCDLWYIGKTSNLNSRWQNHHKFNALKAVGVDTLYYYLLPELSNADISILERLYITMFFPRFNDRHIAGFEPDDVNQSYYQQGFDAGYEKGAQDAIDYYSQEISLLHARILKLQGGSN